MEERKGSSRKVKQETVIKLGSKEKWEDEMSDNENLQMYLKIEKNFILLDESMATISATTKTNDEIWYKT